ncbi:DUF3885 domain-containing protein [Cellulomonas xiejunii]|uniref:DUF3885 domain-containing protein n=1 Tax=Cellulomonas xiejunii TaxID=2968083 RepID=A0ABY5KRM1_9CELL|nr:hypothetical protein [Cellulomonas xiejunii]MCC2320700.1 hypothetical protein [Cellulomonas xiejunii]UUI70988.1 hypothetical protein NP048_14475 [Cellulomonas xiejunii]
MTSADLDDLVSQVRTAADDVSAARRVEVYLGAAHEPYPPDERGDTPVAVVDDPEVVAHLVAQLGTADPTRRVVVQALSGLMLEFFSADDDLLGIVHVLSPHWLRGLCDYDARVASGVLTDLVDRLEEAPWDRAAAAAVAAAESGDPVVMPSRLGWLTDAWADRWPGTRPISHTLRVSDRWVRFHSLPDSQRYPDDEAGYAEVLRRHRAVLDELAVRDGGPGRDVLVVTCSWSQSPVPLPRSAPVAATFPSSRYWMSVDDPEGEVWAHLYVDVVGLDDPRLERLLRIVADGQTAGVLILASDLTWLYAPYDGGADVYPATLEHREQLRAAHTDWLSSTASGL